MMATWTQRRTLVILLAFLGRLGMIPAQEEEEFEGAPHLIVTGCHEATFGHFAQEFCLSKFKSDMGTLRQALWCDWDKTSGWYQELVNCTSLVTTKVDCYWPGKLVDEFFIAVHQHYFKNCPASGRSLSDPPNTILCSFIVVPIFVTLLMTALVVWRSKHSEGII